MDERSASAEAYACTKFATIQYTSMPQATTKTCNKHKRGTQERMFAIKKDLIVINDSDWDSHSNGHMTNTKR